MVSAPAPEGDEGDSSIEHWTEERSWRSADADQPEQTTDQDEPTEECIEAAQGIVADLRPDMWPLDTKQAGRLVARIARLLCFGGYDDEQLAAHLAAPPPPDVRDPFALLLARLRHDRLPILQPALEATPMPFVPSARDGAACEGHPGEVSDHCRICHADLVAIHGVRGDRWRTYGHTPHAALQALNGQSAPTESASEIQIPTQSAYKAVRGHASVDPRETLGKAA